jgi:D-alanyl-D-alanine-carboxypeptidase/D-alanyl-D-alanine-endopeptidase
MTWGKQAAHSLAETLGSWFTAGGVAAAATAIDASGTVIAASPPDLPADGRFEIGSVTKTMTATVLAALAADGVLGLGDPIGRWLSAGPHGEITIRQLATHTSGLPAVARTGRRRRITRPTRGPVTPSSAPRKDCPWPP